jgi:hypothetical protein
MSFGKITNEKSHPIFRFVDSELGVICIVVVFLLVTLMFSSRAAAQ